MCMRMLASRNLQGRLHHRKLGANAPKKFQGGDLTSNQGGMFQIHEILSVDSQANCKNCCHQMAEFKAKMHQIQNRDIF